ncbi:F-box/kelch-repeat protein At3g23880-like [Vicia villosa]|uniref:F-box/kelch-repeat protein At3g23880-like n=1 Tax=Vicia villosa TaxID=3911 RepID=UPI00273CCB59|nr:F-box/kelch-repeat protein At3g23880-like [Vicia villosa]XP_058732401.1 F-box/kelch-repeat protein At3g23880-like [Vicia villosa]XP_058732402.1 F-box/kelch-repeat protein At3g23880-like [Vicia villosa]
MAKSRKKHRKPPARGRRKQPEPATLTSSVVISVPDDFPFDLVEEILCRVSVKQLIQLRCVCKSWNSLISQNSNFANKHLRLSTSNQSRHHLFLKCCQFVNFQSPVSTFFTSTDPTMSRYSLRQILKKGESDRDGGGYVSTCDGILCYKIDTCSAILFNPSIRKFILLPPLKHKINAFYTLVYDRFINNYKVIVLYHNEVYVLTLGTNYWTRIQDFPTHDQLLASSTGIFVNDSVNWLTSHFIVSLHLKKESYQNLSLPVSLPVSNVGFRSSCFDTLGTWKGCLSLLIPMRDTFSDFWIMKEFGKENSWTKLLSIPYMQEWGFFRYTKMLYISEDDQVLLEIFMCRKFKYMLVVYDSINNTFNFPEFQNKIHPITMPEVYVESLISPF